MIFSKFIILYEAAISKSYYILKKPNNLLVDSGGRQTAGALLSVYDAAWTMAVTLNWTLPLFRTSLINTILNDANYHNVKLADGMAIGAGRISFTGATVWTLVTKFEMYNTRRTKHIEDIILYRTVESCERFIFIHMAMNEKVHQQLR